MSLDTIPCLWKRLGLDLALEPQLFQVLSIFSLEKAGKYNLGL